MRQHLTAVKAAAEVGGAEVRGNSIGSQDLTFTPQAIRHGQYHFAVGTAGSATLVLQTVLPALLLGSADQGSELVLEGGTHNPFAPPFDFLERAFLPLVARMGPRVEARLERPGFYPAGGGKFTVSIEPAPRLTRLDLPERGEIRRRLAEARVSRIPLSIAEREIGILRGKLPWPPECFQARAIRNSRGPGNILVIQIESEHVTEVFTGFGKKGVPSEQVVGEALHEVREYLAADVPVSAHLADQLLIPMALAGGGMFRTLAPSRHTMTNIEVIQQFLDMEITAQRGEKGDWEIEVG
jgi:RNA 3'-terminal phosphate cyclase (ATP)